MVSMAFKLWSLSKKNFRVRKRLGFFFSELLPMQLGFAPHTSEEYRNISRHISITLATRTHGIRQWIAECLYWKITYIDWPKYQRSKRYPVISLPGETKRYTEFFYLLLFHYRLDERLVQFVSFTVSNLRIIFYQSKYLLASTNLRNVFKSNLWFQEVSQLQRRKH